MPSSGVQIGDIVPDIRLVDIETGEAVATSDFLGRRAIFFMWASW